MVPGVRVGHVSHVVMPSHMVMASMVVVG